MAEPADSSSFLRKLLPYTTAALVAVALVHRAATLWSRHQANQDAIQAQKEKEAQQDEAVLHQLGDGSLKVLSFYASPAAVRAGERALVCYGVSNAKEVKIEPPLAMSFLVKPLPRNPSTQEH